MKIEILEEISISIFPHRKSLKTLSTFVRGPIASVVLPKTTKGQVVGSKQGEVAQLRTRHQVLSLSPPNCSLHLVFDASDVAASSSNG